MTRFLVLEPGEGSSGRALFLRDRFSVLALLLPFTLFLRYRLFLVAGLAFLLQAGLLAASNLDALAVPAQLLLLALGLAAALEGPPLAARLLRRRGYREAAILWADGRDEAEILYYGPDMRPSVVPKDEAPPVPRPALPAFGWRSARTLLDAGGR